MANIKLKNALGTASIYNNVKKLSIPNADDTNSNIDFVNVEGNINITNTNVVDVTNYATAQIVDTNLTAANIAKDVTVLGITGTHQGGIIPEGSITITTNTTTDVTTLASVVTNVPQALPIDISTDEGMTAVLISENIGKCYKFTGTTGTYTNGDLYVVTA